LILKNLRFPHQKSCPATGVKAPNRKHFDSLEIKQHRHISPLTLVGRQQSRRRKFAALCQGMIRDYNFLKGKHWLGIVPV
jgi:hypothetical protein